MKKLLLPLLLICITSFTKAQLLRPLAAEPQTFSPKDQSIKQYLSFKFDKDVFAVGKSFIPKIANIHQLNNSNALIELPLASGNMESFYLAEIDILSKETAELYPDIKTYDVLSLDGSINGRLTLSPAGIRAMLLTKQGRVNIEPHGTANAIDHVVFAQKDQDISRNISCGVKDQIKNSNDNNPFAKTTLLFGDCTLRTYNLAVAATGEYTTLAGSQALAIAAITANVANISLLYERELAIKFTLVTNNSIVYTNAATDPYPTASFPTQTILDNNTTALNTNIGAANYNLGIVFNDGWNGGLAYTPGVCDPLYKGGAASGLAGSLTGSVLENVTAHELAHMFSANHTMSAGTGSLCLDNLNQSTAYEIGGGSTLMAYAGSVCTGLAYQNNSDNYFHYNSLSTVLTYAQSLTTCGVASVLSNNAPILTVPATSYTIPHSTPFELIANGTDVNSSDVLKYNFDQYNVAGTPMTAPPATTATSGPMFRSYPPTTSNTRVFPALSNVLNNTTSTWEVLPSVTRTLNFRAMVRDQASAGGCLAQESIAVNVNSGSGPFTITSNNSAASYTFGGAPIALTWNVAGTTAAPVSAANVDILFSTDNGQTFPYILLSNTPNDGSENITVPNLNTYAGRIKVKGSNNIFLDINNAAQTITSTCAAAGATFSPDATVSATAGSPSLNLGLSANYGTALTMTGTINSSDPAATIAVVNGSGSNCINYSNEFRYDLYSFQVNVAGNYTFTQSGATPFGTIFTLYQNSYDPSNPCNNFITSNGVVSGPVNINGSLSASLIPGLTYVMAIGTFSNTTPSTPFSYTLSVTPPGGGSIFTGTPNPGASYTYTFVVVNSTTGNITGFSTNGDMTNTTTYPTGNYLVYGLSHATSVTLPTLNGYVGTSFAAFKTALLNNTICGNLSSNSKTVIVGVVTSLAYIKLTGNSLKDFIKLNWEVGGALNMDRYIVEKSATSNDFSAIGNVMAGTKAIYNMDDIDPKEGNNFYRIKAVDKNGIIQYSNMILIPYSRVKQDGISVYPNPAKTAVTITTPTNAAYDCELTDISGKEIQSFRITNGTYSLNVKSLSKGVYMLHGKTTNNNFVTKIVVE